MSRLSDIAIDIQCDLEESNLSFAEIAERNEVPIAWVIEVAEWIHNDELKNLQSNTISVLDLYQDFWYNRIHEKQKTKIR